MFLSFLFTMHRKGNRNWGGGGQPLQAARADATEFDVKVQQLGLTTQICADSMELRRWCESNRNRCYIPEWLLSEWGISVDPTSS
jgi:hypothetical protein